MEHWKLHEDFCNLFEKRIEACLTENGYSVDEFWDALMKFVDGQKGATGAAASCSRPLRAATDYRQFAVTMRQMRRDRSGKSRRCYGRSSDPGASTGFTLADATGARRATTTRRPTKTKQTNQKNVIV